MALALMFSSAAASAAPEVAKRANDFVDSVCVATHWSYPDTPYGARFEEVKARLVDSHIRHCRDGLHPRMHDLARAGVTCTVVTDTGSPSPDPTKPATSTDQIRDAIKAFNAIAPAAIDSVEAPNEPDLFWFSTANGVKSPTRTYGGSPFPVGALAFVRDLRGSLRSDAATANLPFIGIALGSTLAPGDKNPLGDAGQLSTLVDWGNFHPYCGGNPFSPDYFLNYESIPHYYMNSNFPSANLDWTIPVAAKPYGALPLAATETGYSTSRGSLSLALHGKYMPRLFLEYFRRGIKRSCSYELVDEHDNPDDRESNFGLLHNDLTEKPAYAGIKNLLTILDDHDAMFAVGSLDYSIAVQPVSATVRGQMVTYDHLEFVHHLLLEKGNGRFDLVIWHEVSGADTSSNPMTELAPPPLPVTVTTGQPFAAATVYRLDDKNQVQATSTDPRTVKTQVTDRPLVIEWTPVPAASADGGVNSRADAAAPEVASDPPAAGAPDSKEGGGCSCRVTHAADLPWWQRAAFALALLVPFALLRRRAAVRATTRASATYGPANVT